MIMSATAAAATVAAAAVAVLPVTALQKKRLLQFLPALQAEGAHWKATL